MPEASAKDAIARWAAQNLPIIVSIRIDPLMRGACVLIAISSGIIEISEIDQFKLVFDIKCGI